MNNLGPNPNLDEPYPYQPCDDLAGALLATVAGLAVMASPRAAMAQSGVNMYMGQAGW